MSVEAKGAMIVAYIYRLVKRQMNSFNSIYVYYDDGVHTNEFKHAVLRK